MKRVFAILFAVMMICMSVTGISAKTIFVDGDWVYEATPDVSAWEIDVYSGADAQVKLPASFAEKTVIAIGDHAFMNNTTMIGVDTGEVLNTIGEYSFIGCEALNSVCLYPALTEIGVGAFANTSALSVINFEDSSVVSIPAYCFSGSGLETITLPETCTSIGNCAFQNCSALTSVTIPASVTSIHENAFVGCEKVVICAPYGSYAVEYAIAHDYDYAYSGMQKYTFYRGDADGDGDITIMDATRVQRVLAHFDDDVDGTIAIRAAMDEDRVLGIMDATRIQRQLAQFDDPYGIGKEVTVYLLPDGSIFEPDKINA